MEMKITFLENYGFSQTCYEGSYFEIRDGLSQSAHLLGVFCELYKGKEYIFRSSGRDMWLKLQRPHNVKGDEFHVTYTLKQLNVTGM